MSFYEHKADKKSGDGLALTEWNDLSSSLAGNSGLTLAKTAEDKIGIGTDQPEQKLHVKSGGLLIQSSHNDVTADIGAFFAKNLTQGIGIGYNRIEAVGKNPDQHILLKPKGSGNVGIGTTSSPEEKLHVSGNIKATKFIGDGSGLTNLSVGLTGINLATATGSMVGVGTDSPTDKLQIGGYQAGDRYLSVTTAGGNKYKAGIKLLAWKKDFGVVIEHDEIKRGLNFHFKNPYGAGSIENMLFLSTANGHIGIGTSSPNAKLNVMNKSTDANGDTLILGPINESNLRLGYHTNYSWIQSHGSKPLVINPLNNSVGIGTTTPNDALDVNGTLRLTGGGNFCRMFTIDKKLVFTLNNSTHGANRGMSWDGDTNWDSYSDERLKTNVSSEQNILDRLVKLDVKNYDWKGSPEKEIKMIGFIAQDVKPLFPALVGEIEDPETMQKTMTLKYASFGVLAVGAIKELKQEIDSLQQQFKNLKNGFPALD